MLDAALITRRRSAFSPVALFANSVRGVWFSPSPATCFTDTAGTTPCSVGDSVARMNDLSGNGNHALQATAASRPILRESGGHYYLDFDGTDDFMSVPAFSIINQPITITAAWKDDVANSGHILVDGDDATNRVVLQNRFAGELRGFAGTALDTSAGAASTDVAVTTFVANGSSSFLRRNGAQVAYGNAGSAGLDGLRIGTDSSNNAGVRLDGRVYQLIIRGALSSEAEIQRTEKYAANKSGVNLLPFQIWYSGTQNIIDDTNDSLREHSIVWHEGNSKYYLITDRVPVASPNHPNTYDTELHLYSSADLTTWSYVGVCVEKGGVGELGEYGVASPSGAAVKDGKIYVPFSARNNSSFAARSIGLAWSTTDPDVIPWTKADDAISDLTGEDDDPALVLIGSTMHLYHRTTVSGQPHRIVHSQSDTPETESSWSSATEVTIPRETFSQELTGAVYFNGEVHLFVMEIGGGGTAHLASSNPSDANFPQYDPDDRFVPLVSNIAYNGHFSVVMRDFQPVAYSWTVFVSSPRYGIDLRLAQ